MPFSEHGSERSGGASARSMMQQNQRSVSLPQLAPLPEQMTTEQAVKQATQAIATGGANSGQPGIDAFRSGAPKVLYKRRNQTYGSFYQVNDPRLIPLDQANQRRVNASQEFSRHLLLVGFFRDGSLADMKDMAPRPGKGPKGSWERTQYITRP